MSIASFSQSIYKVKNDTLLCFNKEQLKIIVNDLKQNNYNELLISELESKYILLDSLNNVYLEIIINRDKKITIQEKIITDLNSNIEDYKNLNIETEEKFKQKIKNKNNTIIKLVITNIITVAILLIVIK
jgi:hypothetical protein